jgi:DNA-binding CsgD family transcriptional regulator
MGKVAFSSKLRRNLEEKLGDKTKSHLLRVSTVYPGW